VSVDVAVPEVVAETASNCLILTLNRPTRRNVLSVSMLEHLAAALDRTKQSGVRAVILSGAGGRAFCAGADVRELQKRSPDQHLAATERAHAIFRSIERLPIPSIAAIDGLALGGGLELAMACTFRVASATSQFGLPEVTLGMIPGFGGTQRLPRLVGVGRALELTLTGARIDAARAFEIGLINRLITGFAVEGALALADELAGFSLPVLELARRAVTGALDSSLDDGLAREAILSTRAFSGSDATEGITAFLERRTAQFLDA
jgi:enoyl-CoA hydratase